MGEWQFFKCNLFRQCLGGELTEQLRQLSGLVGEFIASQQSVDPLFGQ